MVPSDRLERQEGLFGNIICAATISGFTGLVNFYHLTFLIKFCSPKNEPPSPVKFSEQIHSKLEPPSSHQRETIIPIQPKAQSNHKKIRQQQKLIRYRLQFRQRAKFRPRSIGSYIFCLRKMVCYYCMWIWYHYGLHWLNLFCNHNQRLIWTSKHLGFYGNWNHSPAPGGFLIGLFTPESEN